MKRLLSTLVFRPAFAVLVTLLSAVFFPLLLVFGLVQTLAVGWETSSEYLRSTLARWRQMLTLVWRHCLQGFRHPLHS